MKNKHIRGIIIDIITIALCITAIFVGVFSVKNANLNISGEIGFEKHDKTFYIASVTEKIRGVGSALTDDVTTNKLCLTMGHSIVGSTETEAGTDGTTSTPIQWYAFAVKGESMGNDNYIYNNTFYTADDASAPKAERWYSLYGVDMSNKDYRGKTFWFVQQYIVAGDYENSDGTYVNGIQYDSECNVYSQTSKKSSIYKFLNGTDESSYVSKTGISSDDTYEKIAERVVDESYTVKFSNDYVTNGTLACNFTSRFWLLSHAELELLVNRSFELNNSDFSVMISYGINNQKGDSYKYGASWCLRSPDPSSFGKNYVKYVENSGDFKQQTVNTYFGVRAAFQIAID